MASSSGSSKPYISRGQVLQSPPLTAKLRNFICSIYIFLGLYFVSLFSIDPYTSAQNSQFNIKSPPNRNTQPRRPGWRGGSGGSGGGDPRGGGGGGGGWGWGSGGGGAGGPSKRIGRVDDVRGPECRSCG